MRTWTPNGHRLSGAVFWVIWTVATALVGAAGGLAIASSGQGSALWGGVFALGAVTLLGFGAIFGRYSERPIPVIGAVGIGAALIGLAIFRSGAAQAMVPAAIALGAALAVIAALRFVKTPLLAALLALVLAGAGIAAPMMLGARSAPDVEASAPQAPTEAPATEAAPAPQDAQPPAAEAPTPAPEQKPAEQPSRAPAGADAKTAFEKVQKPGFTLPKAMKVEKPIEIGPKVAMGSPPPLPPPPPSAPPGAEDEASAAPPPPMAGEGPIATSTKPMIAAPGSGLGASNGASAGAGASPEPDAAPPPQKVGSFSVNKPERMSVLKSVQIEVQVGVEGEPAPTELGSGGPVTTRTIEVSRKMDVELVSNDFDVTPDGKNGPLLVLPGKPARWAWQVKPRSAGPGKVIKVNVYSVLGDDRALVKTHQETIEVTVTPVERATLVARWSKDNWEPLASLVGGIVAAFGFVSGLLGLRKKKPDVA